MDHILTDIWNQLTGLSSTQWVLVFSLSFIFGFIIFKCFNWIYQQRLEAQNQVIGFKEEMIKNLKKSSISESNKSLADILPNDWEPFLSQSRRQLEEVLEELEQQQPMNYTVANIGFIVDAELFFRYIKIVGRMSASDAKIIKEEQKKWLSKRKKHCESEAKVYEGGTIAPFIYGQEFIKFTLCRMESLKEEYGDT